MESKIGWVPTLFLLVRHSRRCRLSQGLLVSDKLGRRGIPQQACPKQHVLCKPSLRSLAFRGRVKGERRKT